MTDKKPVVVSAVVHEKSQYIFHFVFEGDVADRAAMKEAAWHMLNTEKMLAPLECVDREFVNDESDGTAIEVDVELGDPDDYREKPKQRTKKQLWRRVARRLGELLLLNGPDDNPHIFSSTPNAKAVVADLLDRWRWVKKSKRQQRVFERLERAFVAWEAAQ